MAHIRIKLGGREPLQPGILKATPLGALGTDAIVRVGQLELSGRAQALRALADALVEAAERAESYDADPAGYDEREAAERAATERD
jgi:hypothetical protein